MGKRPHGTDQATNDNNAHAYADKDIHRSKHTVVDKDHQRHMHMRLVVSLLIDIHR
jgi:hypothetical protein